MLIQSEAEIKQEVRKLKDRGQTIVFTNGCFDLLHVGHIRYLQQAKNHGHVLWVGLNSDDSVKRLKGPTRPIQTEQDRAEILLALKSVDYVTIFHTDTPYELIALIRPNVLVKGGDWPVEKIVGHDLVQSWGGQVLSLQFVPGRSSSLIIEKISKL